MHIRFKTRNLPISTGGTLIAVFSKEDAQKYDLNFSDRISIKKGRNEVVATVDITERYHIVEPGEVGVFREVHKLLGTHEGDHVEVKASDKLISLHYIKEKMKGEELREKQMHAIVSDIVQGRLTEMEIAYFVAGCYINRLSFEETVALTKAMIKTGDVLKVNKSIIVDKHCVGGVAGNRTTMLIVPLVAAAGLTIPKTSSRSITSAAGTSDTVEVLCQVSFDRKTMRKIVQKHNGCFVWGGAVNLAPADDKIIRVERPLALDPKGQMVASILAKKRSVSATHVIIDIPMGDGSKIVDHEDAEKLGNLFIEVGKRVGMKIHYVLTDGSEPIGNGIGPALEARDVIYTLLNSSKGSLQLKEKSLYLAGKIFEMTGKARKNQGIKLARQLFDSGRAYQKFVEIVKAQHGHVPHPEAIRVGRHTKDIVAKRSGIVKAVENKYINYIARFAGAPLDKEAGVYLYVHKGDIVKRGQKLFTVYSDSEEKLKQATVYAEGVRGVIIK